MTEKKADQTTQTLKSGDLVDFPWASAGPSATVKRLQAPGCFSWTLFNIEDASTTPILPVIETSGHMTQYGFTVGENEAKGADDKPICRVQEDIETFLSGWNGLLYCAVPKETANASESPEDSTEILFRGLGTYSALNSKDGLDTPGIQVHDDKVSLGDLSRLSVVCGQPTLADQVGGADEVVPYPLARLSAPDLKPRWQDGAIVQPANEVVVKEGVSVVLRTTDQYQLFWLLGDSAITQYLTQRGSEIAAERAISKSHQSMQNCLLTLLTYRKDGTAASSGTGRDQDSHQVDFLSTVEKVFRAFVSSWTSDSTIRNTRVARTQVETALSGGIDGLIRLVRSPTHLEAFIVSSFCSKFFTEGPRVWEKLLRFQSQKGALNFAEEVVASTPSLDTLRARTSAKPKPKPGEKAGQKKKVPPSSKTKTRADASSSKNPQGVLPASQRGGKTGAHTSA